MNRIVSRKMTFTVDDVKRAILDLLLARSQRAPLDSDDTVSFSLSSDGAVMEWTERDDLDLS